MKIISLILLLVFTVNAQTTPLRFKGKIGFVKAEDKFEKYKFLAEGEKIIFVGKKNLQLWDVKNFKLISNISYEPHSFSRANAVEAIITLGIGLAMRWASIEIDPHGKWFAAIEEGQKGTRNAVVRDLQTGQIIANLDFGRVPIHELFLINNKILLFGKDGKVRKYSFWDSRTFQPLGTVLLEDYRWHQVFINRDKLLVGSGDQKMNWISPESRQGSRLKIWDIRTGRAEKEFTAPNLIERDYFRDTHLSRDEKYILSKRDRRIFIWEVDGNGSPKIEISSTDPKEKPELVEIIDGQLVVIRADGKTLIYEFGGEGKLLYTAPHEKGGSLKITKNNRFIAVPGKDEISLLDLQGHQTSTIKMKPKTENEMISYGEFVDDGNYWGLTRYNKTDKSTRSEFYNTKTGKIDFEVPFNLGYETTITADRKYLFTEGIGGSHIWKFSDSSYFTIKLRSYTTTCNSDEVNCYEAEYNAEHTLLSPDEKLIYKFGDSQTVIFDIETGKEIQQIFDADEVEYDKQNKIKDSGIDNLEFLENGKYVLSVERSGGGRYRQKPEDWRYCYGCRTLGVWELSN